MIYRKDLTNILHHVDKIIHYLNNNTAVIFSNVRICLELMEYYRIHIYYIHTYIHINTVMVKDEAISVDFRIAACHFIPPKLNVRF